ncbi:conserved hypothetical protein [Candida dubliniensis CD36]|uniref:HMG box domain-containing protein n=1 Tax=Candida dubliniensis (strain CD36 / ATCC MYA-646 / CBS 7987 / NCPF 3949 / NRRL Y-17841) TaxID=573826 RepID=B9W8N2_CANDC|nr:conserved hypothetical protein [Candida dubliniensis CD36]CAX45105.1 conserved hypothetical protein [Candida dubliniensis CD36]
MLRSFVTSIRPIAYNATAWISIRALATTAATSTTKKSSTKASPKTPKKTPKKSANAPKVDTKVVRLQNKINTAKSIRKNLQQQIKEISAQHKTLSKERKFEEKATRKIQKLSPNNFYAMAKKVSINVSVSELNQLSEEERAKWIAARDAYWEKAKSYFTPKPKLGANGFAKYVQVNYVRGESITDTMKKLADEWRELSETEKQQYKISKEDREQYKKAFEKWRELRVKEYKDYLKFKENYRVEDYL